MANKSLAQLQADFAKAAQKTEQLQTMLPSIIGAEAVKVVKQNFDLQGYDSGAGFTPWRQRADVTNQAYDYNRVANAFTVRSKGKGRGQFLTPSGRKSKARNKYKGSVYSSQNKIMLQTRNLYRNLTYFAGSKRVTVGVNETLIVYAKKLNEGGRGTWGKKATTHTPARQFQPYPNQPPNKKILTAVDKKVKYEQYQAMKDFRK